MAKKGKKISSLVFVDWCDRSRVEKIDSTSKMAAVRREVDDLLTRCISLLQEVKDLIEAHNSGQENADETAAFTSRERQTRPLSTVQQHQGNAT